MSEKDRIEPVEEGEIEVPDKPEPDPDKAVEQASPVTFFNKDFTAYGDPTEEDLDTAVYDFRPKDPEDIVLANGNEAMADEFPKDSFVPESAGSSQSQVLMEPESSASQEPSVPVEKDSGKLKESASGTQTSSGQTTTGNDGLPASA